MKNQVLIYDNNNIRVSEEPIAIQQKYYLVKPIYVFVDGVENYIISGYAPLLKPVVIGHTGVARIIEAGFGSPSESSGSLIVVSPLSFINNSVLGYTANGLLAKYATIPYDAVFTTLSKHNIEDAILYHAAIGAKVGELVGTNDVLVVGLGIDGIAALYALEKARDVAIVTSSKRMYGLAKRLGYNVYKSFKEVKRCFTTVYISTLSASVIAKAQEYVCYNGKIIVNPLTAHIANSIALDIQKVKHITVTIAYPDKSLLGKIDRFIDNVVNAIKVIKPRSLEELKTLFPIKPPGAIIDLTELK
ncbi:hypothetical protein J4526_04980 [Desulfurococcaceae archaeon MEX13E-LK6-19]|nr:hypothetical protein J4526_04980 [Desulfurococcaceae archaeon MEX13E-LK6-19]